MIRSVSQRIPSQVLSLPQPQPNAATTYESTCAHIKQYGPCWIFNATAFFAGIGQYGLNRLDIVAVVVGVGFVAMHVFCRCFGNTTVVPDLSVLAGGNAERVEGVLQSVSSFQVLAKQ